MPRNCRYLPLETQLLGGRFGYFLVFLLGEGEGESEAPGRGGFHFLLKIPGRGGGFQEGPRGREGVCGELGNLGGGGGRLNIVFGAETSTKIITSCFCFGELFSVIITGNFTAWHSWGRTRYCNVTIRAVYPWKLWICRLQLHIFSRLCVGLITVMKFGFFTDFILFVM